MGKKKKKGVKKTKEISSVSVAESSTTTELPPQAPRKRGRPRKIIEKNQEFGETDSKKAKTIDETEEEEERGDKEKKLEEIIKEELVGSSEDKASSKQQPRRSSARRKSKPRKCS